MSARIGSLTFAKRGLVCRAKGNVPIVGRLLNKKCVSANKKTLSGRLVWSAVIPIGLSLYVIFSIFMSLSFFLGLLVTFLGLAKVGIKKYQSSNLAQKLIESTNVQPSTKAPLLPNPCYAFALLIWSSFCRHL